jgi:hypothetical protein
LNAALWIIVGLFGGCVLVGIVVVAILFFVELKKLRDSLDQSTKVLRTLSKDNTLADSLQAFSEMNRTGQSMLKMMGALNTTIELFYKVAVNTNAVLNKESAKVPLGEQESNIYFSDEVEMAQRETQRKVRTAGVQVEPAEVEISSANAFKAGDV